MVKTADTNFYVLPEDISGDNFTLKGDECRHLKKVLRLQPGDTITAVDGIGNQLQGILTEYISKDEASFEITSRSFKPGEPGIDVILLQAVMKGDRFEYLVEKAVEIGVFGIIPIITERTIVDPSPNKVERWRRIAVAAMKQSGRSYLPRIFEPTDFTNSFELLEEKNQKLLLFESGDNSIRSLFVESQGNNTPIYVAIGPEGDFTDEELSYAIENGFLKTTLGKRRLRSETAGIAALSIILSYDNSF